MVVQAQARIVLLATQVANAIAAGEVVERPASVVKELCENAIDAGASHITVQIDGGGTVRISVVDNGEGILSEDLPLAVARHATSKIASVQDLAAISTLGFRGEALASIAAVSGLTIRSAQRKTPSGRELKLRAGEVVADTPTAAIPGTSVEVYDLFFNTPARLRFLRSSKTETARCVRIVSNLALAHPEVAFTCVIDGKSALRTNGGSLLDAAAAVFGRAEAPHLLEVHADGESTVAVRGFISQPHRHRGQRTNMVIIVNGRRVHNRALYVAVENAYRSLVPSGRYPLCALTVEVDQESVDVNVHPTKQEVRFSEERSVFSAIERACWAALSGSTFSTKPPVALPGWPLSHNAPTTSHLIFEDAAPMPAPSPSGPSVAHPTVDSTLSSLAPLQTFGQVNNEWIVAGSARGIVIVDPHAAHEKLVYTNLMDQPESPSTESQLLLIPVAVELNPTQMAAVSGVISELAQWGFDIEEFGPTSVRCTAVPGVSASADIERLIPELIDEVTAGNEASSTRKHRAAALVACHSAVRFGDPLGAPEQQRLLDELVTVPHATTCPHGRPTVLVLDDPALRRAFARPQR